MAEGRVDTRPGLLSTSLLPALPEPTPSESYLLDLETGGIRYTSSTRTAPEVPISIRCPPANVCARVLWRPERLAVGNDSTTSRPPSAPPYRVLGLWRVGA